MPSKTRCLVLFIETKNFDEAADESTSVPASLYEEFERHPQGDGYSFTGRLTKGLPRRVNRHGRCAERLMPMRLSATTSNVALEWETKQWRGSEHRSISWSRPVIANACVSLPGPEHS